MGSSELPLVLIVDGLTPTIKLASTAGVTTLLPPLGSPFVKLTVPSLAAGKKTTITLVFTNASRKVRFKTRLLAGPGTA